MLHRLFGLFLLLILAVPALADAISPAERALNATLVLYSDDDDRRFLGSGFAYGNEGLVLSNAHVVGDAGSVRLRYRDGQEASARVLARDARRDIAVLQLPLPVPGLMPGPAPHIGDQVIATGAPLEAGFTASRGIVAADPRQIDPTVPLRFLQHDAALNPGSSGGALIDARGALVGMNSQIADGSRLFVGISYAIQAGDLARLVPLMLAGTLPPIPSLGVDARPVTPKIAAALDVAETGLLIDDVLTPDSGLQAGDILLALGGHVIDAPGAVGFALAEARSPIRAEVLRDGTRQTILVALTPAPLPPETMRDLPFVMAIRLGDLSILLDSSHTVIDLPATGLAAGAGLTQGDRILRVNGQIAGADVATRAHSGPILLLIEREGRHLHVTLDPQSTGGALRPLGSGNALDLSVRRY